MGSFQITDQADTLTLDTAGNVTSNGVALGAWTVSKDNQLQINQTDRGIRTVPVNWSFNSANELILTQPNTQNMFNFFGDLNTVPSLSTSKAVLTVQADSNNTFSFQLRPTWNLESNYDMTVTIAGTASKIDGLLGDRQDGGFDYIFQTNDDLLAACTLNFTGTWKQRVAGTADLIFEYDTEPDATGNTTKQFDLPDGLGVDTATNMLTYRASKQDQSSVIGIIGTLTIHGDFSITYEIQQQDIAGVNTSTFNIQADLVKSSVGTATLDLNLKKAAGSTTVSIGGTYQGTIGDNAKLTVGFSYQRQVSGGTTTTLATFQGEVQTQNDDFVWAISDQQGTLTITAQVSFVVGSTCAEGALNFQTSQGQVAITAMFSITTGCTQVNSQAVTALR
jgi:hypothetical protein